MKIFRLPVLATSFATCMVVMLLFLACVIFWAVSHDPSMHILLPYILPGFPAVTLTGVVAGLVGGLVFGNIVGATFARSFNSWMRVVGGGRAMSDR